MTITKETFYSNNFNFIRLFAAAQVVHYHLISIFGLEITKFHALLLKVFGFFPGVPIFFFISGFLISKSWEEKKSLKVYGIKRLARIEPALFCSIIFAVGLTYISGYLSTPPNIPNLKDLVSLILSKATIFQFYNPDFLRHYGDGVLNGSLWTITVELQFYFLIPILYGLLKLDDNSTKKLVVLILLFMGINEVYDHFHDIYHANILVKLFGVSFAPWIFMFLTGIFFQKHFIYFHRLLAGKFLYLLATYLCFSTLGLYLNLDFGNSLNSLAFLLLCCLIFSAAYSKPKLAKNIIGDIDISYGLYLYHMPIINYFLYLQIEKSYTNAALLCLTFLGISLASWLAVEKPALNHAKQYVKKFSNRAVVQCQ